MTDKQQRHSGATGAGETAILKLIGIDHTGKVVAIQRPSDRQQKVNLETAPPVRANAQVAAGAHAFGGAYTLIGPVVSTSIDGDMLTITIIVGQQLPVSLVVPVQSKNTGIQQAGLTLLADIACAAGFPDMRDTDELIGCEVAVTVRAGGRHG